MTRGTFTQVPVVYANDEHFQIGKAKILRQAEGDQVSHFSNWMVNSFLGSLGAGCSCWNHSL